MSESALSFAGVRRTFGRTVALRSFDLEVEAGSVVGLVGRNGAGKSTALRLALGLLHPDAGRIRVQGLDPVRQGLRVRRIASLMAEEAALHGWMTVEETLWFAGRLHPRWDPGKADELRKDLDLDPSARVKTLSRGNRARVALILAVACRPRVLLLDDPTASLDPLARREVLEGILESVPSEGGAVLYASHLVQDIERLADRVVVLDEGEIVLEGELEELKRRVRLVEAVLPEEAPGHLDLPGAWRVDRQGRMLRIVSQGDPGGLTRRLEAAGAVDIRDRALPLEEILIACLRRPASPERPREEVGDA